MRGRAGDDRDRRRLLRPAGAGVGRRGRLQRFRSGAGGGHGRASARARGRRACGHRARRDRPGRHRCLGAAAGAPRHQGPRRAAAAGDPLRRRGLRRHAARRLGLGARRRAAAAQQRRTRQLSAGRSGAGRGPEDALFGLGQHAQADRRTRPGCLLPGRAGRAHGRLPQKRGRAAHAGRFRRRGRRVRAADQDLVPRARGVRVPAQRAGRDRALDAQHPRGVRARRARPERRPAGCISRPKPRASRFATATPAWPIPPRSTCRSGGCWTRTTPPGCAA